MSRCFPFPPPGYERKPRSGDIDLLTKEKRKEKKPRKDKKDREREGKEKKDKEKSKDNHREKKERKERHKDKKEKDKEKKDKKKEKDKERKNRDKDEKATSDGKRVEGQRDCYKEKNNGQDDKDSKIVHELARRIRNEEGANRSQVAKDSAFSDQGKSDIPRTLGGNLVNYLSAEDEKYKKKLYLINGQKIRTEVQGIQGLGSTVDSCFSKEDQRGLGSFSLPFDKKYVEKQIEGKWKSECKESEDNCIKVKHRDWEKSIRGKGKFGDKEEEEKEKMREISEAHAEQRGLEDGSKNSVESCSMKHSYVSKNGCSSSGDGNHLGKRKDLGRNGYLHDNVIRNTKLPRHVSSSHQVLENGRNSESRKTALEVASEKHLAASNGRISIKGKKVNGLIDPQQPRASSSNSSSTNLKFSENGEGFQKPPHPDSKYLIQILSVPRADELPETDDHNQDWLFSNNDLAELKSNMSIDGEALQQVWAEALKIPSADVLALPYVIPY